MIEEILLQSIADAIKTLYNTELDAATLTVQKTRKEFDGDLTFAVFPFLKITRLSFSSMPGRILLIIELLSGNIWRKVEPGSDFILQDLH